MDKKDPRDLGKSDDKKIKTFLPQPFYFIAKPTQNILITLRRIIVRQ